MNRFFGFVFALGFLATGCLRLAPERKMTPEESMAAAEQFVTLLRPLFTLSENQADEQAMTEVATAAKAHYRNQGKWPASFPELRQFVDSSKGMLVMGNHTGVHLTHQGDSLKLELSSESGFRSLTISPANAYGTNQFVNPFPRVPGTTNAPIRR